MTKQIYKGLQNKTNSKVRKWESLYFSFGCPPCCFTDLFICVLFFFFTQFPRNLFNIYQFSHHSSDNSNKKQARQKCRLKMNFLKVEHISPQIRAEKNQTSKEQEHHAKGQFP